MGSLVAAFVMMFLLTALPGGIVIERLRRLGAKQNVSENAPAAHAGKQGTPTMGGLMFLFPFVPTILGVLVADGFGRHEPALLPVFLMTVGCALIGFGDDYMSKRRGKNLGMTPLQKLIAQIVVCGAFVFWLARTAQPITTQVQVLPPTLTGLVPTGWLSPIDLGLLYYPIALLFLVGLSNATNFTDGLDGLAGGVTVVIALTLTALFRLWRPELGLFTVALAGGLAGFLWWNAHPAKVFMGDTGSLPVGAALAGAAIAGKQEMALIVVSLVCWAELISVMVQVSVFKWRKRRRGIEFARANRVFRRTPLHHHFEEMGIKETAVVSRFWLAAVVCAAIALLWGRLG